MPMTVLICGNPGSGFQIIGLFANSGDAQSYAEDYSLKDWWLAEGITAAHLQKAKLSHGTNQARRGSRKRPDPRGCEAQGGPGLVICPERRPAQDDQLTNATGCARVGGRHAQGMKESPGRAGASRRC